MSIHKSIKTQGALSMARSVLTRRERIDRLMEEGEFEEGDSPLGLPKVKVRRRVVKLNKVEPILEPEGVEVPVGEEAEEAAETAEAAEESAEAAEESGEESEGGEDEKSSD